MKATQVQALPMHDVFRKRCLVCRKEVTGYYGHWGVSGTCGRKCEEAQEALAILAHENLLKALTLKGE